MKTVFIVRQTDSDFGTEGLLYCPDISFFCYTMEPPWRDNRTSVSCIPPGEYLVAIRHSPKYGKIFHIKNVAGRSYVLIHGGNVGGDSEKGLKTHTQGCILLGQKRGVLYGQNAVLNSKGTLTSFMLKMGEDCFKLIIK